MLSRLQVFSGLNGRLSSAIGGLPLLEDPEAEEGDGNEVEYLCRSGIQRIHFAVLRQMSQHAVC